ncbi:MAG: transglutaminase-like domain-containing protein, partial [Candidatus Woesebacteria bacterium]|nr:transglutaminase-like domain-containing protein [Candidatus Woesebacteria bacterium]
HLENPLGKNAQTQIALPPDTAFQKVYLQKIDPKPSDVTIDPDGNWLATYNLTARQRVDVTVAGSVQIFAGFRAFPKPTDQELSDNLRETEYWQVNDPQIKALALELKTPKAIYDYVSKTLKYDFNRVQPNVQRMGAVKALQNPSQAICMEFTDLFIAIARAAGIPAREINGYAYTENPELQPLSLVADLLHAWPEYYDKDKGVWIPIDPTWASTSGGINYFDKLDLRHFTFVVHGESPVMPYPPGSYKLGPNPQKDVYVSFGKLPENRTTNLNISFTPIRTLPFLNSIYSVKIDNPGPQALYSVYPTVYFDSKEASRDFIETLPPYSSYKMIVKVPFSVLGKGSPSIVEVRAKLKLSLIVF